MHNNISLIGVGIDVEDIDRFSKISIEKNKSFLEKIYTRAELKYCLSKKFPAPHLAVRFVAKEAVYKALQNILDQKTLNYNEIEIVKKKTGAPIAKIKYNKFKNFNILISLSHSKDIAMAIAMVLREN